MAISGLEHTQEYLFGRGFNGHVFCSKCGVHTHMKLHGPLLEIVERMLPERQKMVQEMLRIVPLRLAIFMKVDLATLHVRRTDEGIPDTPCESLIVVREHILVITEFSCVTPNSRAICEWQWEGIPQGEKVRVFGLPSCLLPGVDFCRRVAVFFATAGGFCSEAYRYTHGAVSGLDPPLFVPLLSALWSPSCAFRCPPVLPSALLRFLQRSLRMIWYVFWLEMTLQFLYTVRPLSSALST